MNGAPAAEHQSNSRIEQRKLFSITRSASVAVVSEIVETTLRSRGYAVSRNKPYAGGFITEHYGNPASGLHAIQLELNRAIYMDERRRERGPRFAQVVADFASLADALAAVPLGDLGPFQAAAE